jgi:hypothetical protein
MTNGECNCDLKCIKSWEDYATEGCIYGAKIYTVSTLNGTKGKFGDNNGNILTMDEEEFLNHFEIID